MDGESEPTTPKATPEAKTETITLKCQHTHQRKVREAGDKITVPAGTARKLRAQDVCK